MRYKRYKEGKAISRRRNIGKTVQIVSRIWLSTVYLSREGLRITYRNMYVTKLKIRIKITIM